LLRAILFGSRFPVSLHTMNTHQLSVTYTICTRMLDLG
jgi:hypothetical protein